MAELLNVSPKTYAHWENNPNVNLKPSMAQAVGKFYEQTERLMEDLPIPLDQLIPFHIVATLRGIPQELLLARYRDGTIEGVDLGVLGLWGYRDDLEKFEEDAA